MKINAGQNIIYSLISSLVIMLITSAFKIGESCGLKSGCNFQRGFPIPFLTQYGDVMAPLIFNNLLVIDFIFWFLLSFIAIYIITKLKKKKK